MRCSERQDRWYIFEEHTEWRICSDPVWRLSRSGALTSGCSVVFFPFQLCDCPQCCCLVCDSLHDVSCIGSSQKVICTVLHAFVTFFSKLGSGAMGFRLREQLTHWTDPAVFTRSDQWKGFLSAMVTVHEADLLYMRNFLGGDHQEQVQSRRTDAERPQARRFREQHDEQAVLSSAVRRVLVVGRTD